MIQIINLTPQFYQEAAVFLEKQTSGSIPQDTWLWHFSHFWHKNPFFKDAEDNRGWLILDDLKGIVGIFGNLPLLYQHQGKECLFDAATTWYVDSAYREHSLALLNRYLQSKRIKIDTTPIEIVEIILKKFQFKSLETPWLHRDYIFPCNVNDFVFFLFNKLFKGRVPKTISVCIESLLSWGISLYVQFHNLPHNRKYLIKEIDYFNEDYNDWWNKFKIKYEILAVRNQDALNWFFFGCPELKLQRKVLEIRLGEDLIGYVALKIMNRKVNGKLIRFYEMLDIAILEENEDIFSGVWQTLRLLADREQIAFIKVSPLTVTLQMAMSKRGFISFPSRSRFLYKAPEFWSNCWLTPLDGDRGFF